MRSACTSSSAWGSTWRPLGVRRGRRRPSGGLAIISEFEWVVVGIPVHWQSLGGARNTLIIIQRLKISIDGGKEFSLIFSPGWKPVARDRQARIPDGARPRAALRPGGRRLRRDPADPVGRAETTGNDIGRPAGPARLALHRAHSRGR